MSDLDTTDPTYELVEALEYQLSKALDEAVYDAVAYTLEYWGTSHPTTPTSSPSPARR